MTTPAEQMHVIRSGIADLVPEADLIAKLKRGRPLRVKLGVDPTAPDLHLGHAVPLRKLRQFQDLGHTVVLIIGDFTAFIGDPSGRNTTRPALSREQIDANAETYIAQAFKVLDPSRTEMRRNSEWLAALDFEALLRLTSQFTVARIMERDDFQKRYRDGIGISLHELLYPMAQAYDSVAVEADIELGGTDQLFNLLAGRELMEKMGMEPQACLTLPLLEGTDGVQKMSKSYGNYVGLTDVPSEMFGKLMSIPDEIMIKYYRLCTALSVDEIDALEVDLNSGAAHPNLLKRRLAREIVGLYHTTSDALDAEAAFDRVFKDNQIPENIETFPVAKTDPVHLPALLKSTGLASGTGEARRLIDGGGLRIDGNPVAPGTYDVAWDVVADRVLQVGKRRFARVREVE
ncbi:MAG: tyrosine--tRNA ligase [Actinomycetota bacterium]|nr:MAG: tyrosyl-tRNA [Actinomycetota bacterium]MDO8950732.1 tyrosine--tRNA ligase [Actinomycetota bacterium]MDP3629361.1 tyrosine--tRNA ligase [Actinomycetota bacterium]